MQRLLVLLLIAGASALAQAEDWPQFRGPTGQGHATERGLPLEWSETKNIIWKTLVPGLGWSSPAVANGRVWLTTVVESKDRRGRVSASLRALAFDVATGRELVNAEVFHLDDAGYVNPKNSRASPTPIVDGDRVYVHFGADGTAALSTSGEILWTMHLRYESQHGNGGSPTLYRDLLIVDGDRVYVPFGADGTAAITTSGEILWTTHLRYESQHGNGGSPTLYRDLLIVNCDGNGGDAYVIALDTATGKTRWKTSRRRPADQAYSTPLVITVGQQDQLVSVGAYRAAAYDPLTGQEIWRVSYGDGFSNVPRPVFGQGLVFIATGFQTPALMAVRPDGKGDVTRTHVAWTITRGAPYTPSPLLVGNDLYYVSDTGVLSLADAASGQILWQQRLGGNYSASPVLADGRIYFQSEEGMTTVIAPGREFRRLASNRLDGSTLASMAVSGGSFFIRSHSHLYRIAGQR